MGTNTVEQPEILYTRITHHGGRVVKILQDEDERGGPLICRRRMVGAEVGVLRGMNAATLLARCPNLRLYLVDHWSLNGEWRDPADPPGRESYEEMLLETHFAADRRRIIVAPSLRGVRLIDEPLDFVFIDGDHRYEAALADLRAWWPKVRPGGWLFCHDWQSEHPSAKTWGVDRACEDFLAQLLSDGVAPAVVTYPPPEMVFALRKV